MSCRLTIPRFRPQTGFTGQLVRERRKVQGREFRCLRVLYSLRRPGAAAPAAKVRAKRICGGEELRHAQEEAIGGRHGDPACLRRMAAPDARAVKSAHTGRPMKHKAARQEYLCAIAEFERGCLEFSEGMQKISEEPARPGEAASPMSLLQFGPRKSAKRAPWRGADPAQLAKARR